MSVYADGVSPAVALRDCVTSLSAATRDDGRSHIESRVTVVNVGCVSSADGSSFCRIGHTAVVCGVRAEISRPTAEQLPTGQLVPCVELPALCHSRWRAGPPPERAQLLSARVLAALQASRSIDQQQLIIADGKAVWVLYCDVVCVSDDGNVMEAAMLAVSAALASVTLPTVEYDETTDAVLVSATQRRQLFLRDTGMLPVAVSVALLEGEVRGEAQSPPTLLLDPTANEEDSGCSEVLVVWSGGHIVQLVKPGGMCISQDTLDRCIKLTQTRSQQLYKLIESTLKR